MTFKKILGTLGVVFALSLALVAVPTHAQFSFNPGSVQTGSRSADVTSITSLVGNIANIVIGIIAAISVFYIIYGAVLWMNEGAEKGQKVVVNAVIGLVIAILAFFIVQFAVGAGGFLNNALR